MSQRRERPSQCGSLKFSNSMHGRALTQNVTFTEPNVVLQMGCIGLGENWAWALSIFSSSLLINNGLCTITSPGPNMQVLHDNHIYSYNYIIWYIHICRSLQNVSLYQVSSKCLLPQVHDSLTTTSQLPHDHIATILQGLVWNQNITVLQVVRHLQRLKQVIQKSYNGTSWNICRNGREWLATFGYFWDISMRTYSTRTWYASMKINENLNMEHHELLKNMRPERTSSIGIWASYTTWIFND